MIEIHVLLSNIPIYIAFYMYLMHTYTLKKDGNLQAKKSRDL